jgi:hypothetical protein
LKLRLGYETARKIGRTPITAPGVSHAATKAINSVLVQRLQDQVVDDNPTTRINEERTRDIDITNIASENNINKADLIAVLQSGGFQGPPGDKGDKGAGGSGGSGSGRPPRPGRSGGPVHADEPRRPPGSRHHRRQRCEQWPIPKLKPMPKICSYRQRFRASERKCRDRLSNSR